MIFAFRARENRRLMQQAWELRLMLSPHLKEGSDISALSLFKGMPGAYPDDLPAALRNQDSIPEHLNKAQRKEALRRRNVQRVLHPRR